MIHLGQRRSALRAVARLAFILLTPIAIAVAYRQRPPALRLAPRRDLGTMWSLRAEDGSPTAGDTFSLTVHVMRGSSTTDTINGVPVSGAAVRISKTVWTFIHGNGADTMSGADVEVATGGTDANGDIRFEKLSADLYRIQADGPAGSSLESRWIKREVRLAERRVLVLMKAPREWNEPGDNRDRCRR
jgi:hypothetical protein